MEIYFVIVIILFILAASDLVVGVSNDAVNFLNSAVGSKVAPRHIILLVAGLGIVIGTTFSGGIMEVARKGIFNPEMFYFKELMVIFLAVMIADVLLLDMFNTFALPTSTTVSIVFELLGASVAVSILKLVESGSDIAGFVAFINTGKALAIISGILISVVIAFTFGVLIQFITRLIFTFDYNKRIKRYGAIWGSVAMTFITYFILVKGAKGITFLPEDTTKMIESNVGMILLVSIVFWFIVLQFLLIFTKVNILKPIVLIGTFALALAFAANDLVNFIGVPLAGMSSYIIAKTSGNPFGILMEELRNPVHSNTLILLGAGGIMVATLWLSKKARSVTKTEVNLGRQFEGFERFESSVLSRSIVRMMVGMSNVYKSTVPKSIQRGFTRRFQNAAPAIKDKNAPAFDLLRASVNLMVASVLISFATSLKLPLSTTYVTFMVAMGSSLADKAWGRDSAVYRINGVITVIGGWFFTAFSAFTVAGIFGVIIFYGGIAAIIIMLLIAGYILFRTHILHKERSKDEEEMEDIYHQTMQNSLEGTVGSLDAIGEYLLNSAEQIQEAVKGLYEEDRILLKQTKKRAKKLIKKSRLITQNIFRTVQILEEQEIKKGKKFGKIINAIQEIALNTRTIVQNCFEHIDNNHIRPHKDEFDSMVMLSDFLRKEVNEAVTILHSKDFSNIQDFKDSLSHFKDISDNFDLTQVSRIKRNETSARNSLLYLRISSDAENIANHISNLVTALKSTYESFSGIKNLEKDKPAENKNITETKEESGK